MDMNVSQNSVDVSPTPVVPAPQGVDMANVGLTGNVAPTKKKNNVLYFVLGIGAIIVVAVLFMFKGPESVLNKYGEALVDFDDDLMVEVLHPNVIEMIEDEIDDLDEEDVEDIEDVFELLFDEADDDGLEIKSFEIDEDFEEIKNYDLEEVSKFLEHNFDIKENEVKAARKYEIEFKVEYDGDTEREKIEVLIVKVGANWYIFEDEFIIDELLSVLDIEEVSSSKESSKNAFVSYVDKIVTAVQTQYMYDANGGAIAGSGYYVYDITNDLNLTSTGGYKGYVVVDASDVDDVHYYISMYNDKYQLLNYDVSYYGMPTKDSEEIEEYDEDDVDLNASSAYNACAAIVPSWDYCYNRKGYLVYSGYYS